MRLYLSIFFDRDMSKYNVAPSPGGYEVRTTDGKTYGFDFHETDGWVDTENPKIMHWRCKDEDIDSFPEIEELRHKLTTIESIEDCYIDMEAFEDDDCPKPLKILHFSIQNSNSLENVMQFNDKQKIYEFSWENEKTFEDEREEEDEMEF